MSHRETMSELETIRLRTSLMQPLETNWEWIGPGRNLRGISRERAETLVKIRGGKAIRMPDLEPVGAVAVAKPEYLPAADATFGGAESTYGAGRYNGD